MKGKADLVEGWLKKAASDLVAMTASAQAGALDAACFHAQQAAEKYLKAYLLDRDRDIIHTHNLYKLVDLCRETDSSFSQLMNVAGLLTPFAVEARYDTEFWPTSQTMEEAAAAANRIAKLVISLVESVIVVNPGMLEAWRKAREKFDWEVDLRKFKDASKYPGFFDRAIPAGQIREFEDAFRAEVAPGGNVLRAAEVVFWKNYRNHLGKDRITQDLLVWISGSAAWDRFVAAVKQLAEAPTWDSFGVLIAACGQTSGFATPLTFLSFYDPSRFPMADKRIGKWWARQFPNEPQFTWNANGKIISRTVKSFAAYLAWTHFCRRQATALSNPGQPPWRARDVEMAVWVDVNAQLPLA